ncbi:MAG: FAD:protein FMN transferase [Acutalibacteraceae bacterium]
MDWKNKLPPLAAMLCVLCLLLCGCGGEKKQTIQFFAMDTVMQMTAYGDCAEEGLTQARATVETLADALNAHQSDSALSQLHSGDTVPTFIQYPLNMAKHISRLTDGALDVSLYNLTDAWGFYTKAFKVPEPVEIQRLLDSKGQWDLDADVYTCTEGTKLDLGSLAKGYAAAKAVETLRDCGVHSAIFSLGGNVQTLGQKPDGSDWTVAVTDPLSPQDTVGNLHVGECAVVTSGSYQRNFTRDGKTYHHILDPKTGCPADSGLLSVTVLCDDGTAADGLSTALFVLGAEQTAALYKTSDIPFEALLITEEKEIWMTEGLSALFEQTNETYAAAKILP